MKKKSESVNDYEDRYVTAVGIPLDTDVRIRGKTQALELILIGTRVKAFKH